MAINLTKIPAPRTPVLDGDTNLLTPAWYRYFYNLFTITGGGTNPTNLDELQFGPPTYPEGLPVDPIDLVQQDYSTALLSTVAELTKQVQASELSAEAAMQVLVSQIAEITKNVQAVELNAIAATQSLISRIANLTNDIQGINSQPPQNPQVLWSSVLNQPRIEAYDTSASIALTSTPTLLKPASTAAGANGITYDAATGVFVFSNAGSYSLSLNVNATAVAANQFVYIYAEQDVGAGWVVNANSGKTYELVNANTNQIVYAQSVYRVAGQKVRYYIYSNDGKVSLDTVALPGGVGASVPAIRIQYS